MYLILFELISELKLVLSCNISLLYLKYCMNLLFGSLWLYILTMVEIRFTKNFDSSNRELSFKIYFLPVKQIFSVDMQSLHSCRIWELTLPPVRCVLGTVYACFHLRSPATFLSPCVPSCPLSESATEPALNPRWARHPSAPF